MKPILRRGAFVAITTLPLMAGCASDGCEYLAYEQSPEGAPPLVMPSGVTAPTEGGEYRIPPDRATADAGGCLAVPPMTLPEDVLIEPEERDEEEAEPVAEEAATNS